MKREWGNMEKVAIVIALAAIVAMVIGIVTGNVPPLWPW